MTPHPGQEPGPPPARTWTRGLHQRWGPAITRITNRTNGNFRLTCRLIAPIQRVLDINHLWVVIREVVEAARGSLVIGVVRGTEPPLSRPVAPRPARPARPARPPAR